MINEEYTPLRDRLPELVEAIKSSSDFYAHNETVLEIYEGELLPHISKLMSETLSPSYFKLIEHRVLPLNFSQKIVGKLAKSYGDSPLRSSDKSQEFIDSMVSMLGLDASMSVAEQYSYLTRGYALKPKLTNKGKIKLDVLPYDRFKVIGDDPSDKKLVTVFIEFMGDRKKLVTINGKVETKVTPYYIAYTDKEIMAFDSDATEVIGVVDEDLNGVNPIEAIPFVYGNRSINSLVPRIDGDFLALCKVLPLMLSDINGALMFQCFTLIYGIDVEFNDATISPNVIWDLQSRANSDKPAQIGTLEPTVDSDKAWAFFKNILALWLDSKGIDSGAISSMDSNAMASGLSKAMDELDTTEARKASIIELAKEEKELFILLGKLNNFWTTSGDHDLKLVEVDVKDLEDSYQTEFKEPTVKLDYTAEIKNSIEMLNNGLSYREKEIKRLHPYATEDEIDLMFYELGEARNALGDSVISEGVKLENVEAKKAEEMEQFNPDNNTDLDNEDEIKGFN